MDEGGTASFKKPPFNQVKVEQINVVINHDGVKVFDIAGHPRSAHNLLGYECNVATFSERKVELKWVGPGWSLDRRLALYIKYNIQNKEVAHYAHKVSKLKKKAEAAAAALVTNPKLSIAGPPLPQAEQGLGPEAYSKDKGPAPTSSESSSDSASEATAPVLEEGVSSQMARPSLMELMAQKKKASAAGGVEPPSKKRKLVKEADKAAAPAQSSSPILALPPSTQVVEVEAVFDRPQGSAPGISAATFVPSLSVLGVPITVADSALEDKRVAFEFATNMITPKDKGILEKQSKRDLRQDAVHELISGVHRFLALDGRSEQAIRSLKGTVSDLEGKLKSAEQSTADMTAAFQQANDERVLAEQKLKASEVALAASVEELQLLRESMNALVIQSKADTDTAYVEGMSSSLEEFKPIQDKLYQSGYELGLEAAGIAKDDSRWRPVEIPDSFFQVAEAVEEEAEGEEAELSVVDLAAAPVVAPVQQPSAVVVGEEQENEPAAT